MAALNSSNSEFGADTGGRMKGVCVVKSIVYGNIARFFGKKREEDGHTHQWTVYVKPYTNDDLSAYVKKVHFKLHESYANQNRVVMKPPFEVTETGWGQFEIVIKIYFHDSNERPITLYHMLELFQSGPEVMLRKNTVVSEFYEELVFQDPTALMHHVLTNSHPVTAGVWKHETDCEYILPLSKGGIIQISGMVNMLKQIFWTFTTPNSKTVEEKKKKTLEALLNGKTKIRERINELNEKLKLAKETIARFKIEIDRVYRLK